MHNTVQTTLIFNGKNISEVCKSPPLAATGPKCAQVELNVWLRH